VRLCASHELALGASIRFPFRRGEGFAFRTASGAVRAFVNVCPHRGQPVDVGDGRLFLPDGALECQAHGARFEADGGRCVGGPCAPGDALTPLRVMEGDGEVWLSEAEPDPD